MVLAQEAIGLLKTLAENGANQPTMTLAQDSGLGHAVPPLISAETIPVPITKIEMAIQYLRTHPIERKLSSYDLEKLAPIPGVEINRKMWDRAKQRT